jgi:hypothetical protein
MKRLVAAAAFCLLVACGTKPPPLLIPDKIESFCSDKEPRGTAIDSILSSVSDRIETSEAYPGDAELRQSVKLNSGIIAHWASQPLYMPATAKALGVPGNYINVTDIVIDNQLAGNESRLIYVTVQTPAGPKQLVLRAYDVANVCVEGSRLS